MLQSSAVRKHAGDPEVVLELITIIRRRKASNQERQLTSRIYNAARGEVSGSANVVRPMLERGDVNVHENCAQTIRRLPDPVVSSREAQAAVSWIERAHGTRR